MFHEMKRNCILAPLGLYGVCGLPLFLLSKSNDNVIKFCYSLCHIEVKLSFQKTFALLSLRKEIL